MEESVILHSRCEAIEEVNNKAIRKLKKQGIQDARTYLNKIYEGEANEYYNESIKMKNELEEDEDLIQTYINLYKQYHLVNNKDIDIVVKHCTKYGEDFFNCMRKVFKLGPRRHERNYIGGEKYLPSDNYKDIIVRTTDPEVYCNSDRRKYFYIATRREFTDEQLRIICLGIRMNRLEYFLKNKTMKLGDIQKNDDRFKTLLMYLRLYYDKSDIPIDDEEEEEEKESKIDIVD
jgi:hypothetical protein